jgi:hypothetical protein
MTETRRPPRDAGDDELLGAIKLALPALQALLAEVDDHWGYEDGIYRFYHQSYKVYGLQSLTTKMVEAFRLLMPERELNAWFRELVGQGTGQTFEMDHNRAWLLHTRPIVEAFQHARYFLEMICRYGRVLDRPPEVMPSGWASILYLYGMR